MFNYPIQQKKQDFNSIKHFNRKNLFQIKTKFTQYPEIEKASKPVYNFVKQYILDSQLLTNTNCNKRPIRTYYNIKSFSNPKANTKKTLSTQHSLFSLNCFNTSNDYYTTSNKKQENTMKTSFSYQLISFNRSQGTSDEKNKKETRMKTNASIKIINSSKRKRLFVVNEKRKVHDVNVYNRLYNNEYPQLNYARNAYKIAKIFHNEKFINQIRLDLKALKFNNQLKKVDN